MSPLDAAPAEPLLLEGDAYARGRAQAALCPGLVGHVRAAVAGRLAETDAALRRLDVRRFVAAQREAAERRYPAILAEIRGIAEGFGIAEEALFDYLHCSSAADLVALVERRPDGCTAFSATAACGGAWVGKNRDYRPEHAAIQRVMLHRDPGWGGRALLVLGSLGSPGNFSSGMNSDGLAVADTASRTTDLGAGLHRYFLLTWLLVHCRDVAAALEAIRAETHTGSGLLLLGDASGAVAAVELGHRGVGIEALAAGALGRTNHFVTPAMAPRNLRDAANAASRDDSERRLARLARRLAALAAPAEPAALADILLDHGGDRDALCRHGGDGLATTIAGALWDTRARRLFHAAGRPCAAPWRRYHLDPGARRAAAE